MAQIILLNKPFNTLCQFSDDAGRATLADLLHADKYRGFYPAGRLDYDSEGLVILTNQGALQHHIAHPSTKLAKTYWVQVEGEATAEALTALRQGLELNDGPTRPAKAKIMNEPPLWPRQPPIRYRAHKATSWLQLEISEGRNRQVRRMTAAVGLPTLRLVRVSIGHWHLAELAPGQYRLENIHLPEGSPQAAGKQKSATHKSRRNTR